MEFQFVGRGGRDAASIIIKITILVLFMSGLVLVRRIVGRRRTLTFRRWWWWWESVVVSSKLEKINSNNKGVGDDGDDDDVYSGSSSSRRRIRVEIPKGSVGWPLIGETLDFIACGYTSRPVSFMEKRKSLYGDVFKTHLLGKPVIVSTDPEVNKAVLLNHGNIFTPSYPKSITELFGETSILNIDGAAHRRLHACIGRFLRSPSLKERITRDIEDAVKVSLETWRGRDVVYVQDETKEVTFEILVKVLMSVGPGEDMDFLKREYREFIKGLVCVPIKLPGTQLYKSLKAKKRLLEMVRRIVEERKSSIEHEPATSTSEHTADSTVDDAIDMLLRDARTGNNIDSNDDNYQYYQSNNNNKQLDQRLPLDFISGNIIEMMIPGEDSVPMVMTLVVKFLGENPLALAKLKDENMELKRQKIRSSAAKYDWTDYMSLQFTQNVISETLRMANIINAVWRQSNKDVEIKGYLIPKGWCVLASFTSIHMDEHNYENPYDFDPWRWESQQNKGAAISSNTFTPFGGGQRLCPGADLARLEIAIFLHHLVTTYRWVGEKDEIVYFPTVKMKRKLPVIVTPLADY